MKSVIVGAVSAVAVAAGVSFAGVHWPVFDTGNVNVDEDARSAFGLVSNARNSSNSLERVSCQVYGSVGYRVGNCYFYAADDHWGGCFSSDPDIVNAIAAVQGDSYIATAWNKDGSCIYVATYVDSAYAPKAP